MALRQTPTAHSVRVPQMPEKNFEASSILGILAEFNGALIAKPCFKLLASKYELAVWVVYIRRIICRIHETLTFAPSKLHEVA